MNKKIEDLEKSEDLEWLNKQKIVAELSSQHQALISSFTILPKINSTNTYLLKKAKDRDHLKNSVQVCVAEEQTDGRGRQGKDWYSPKGRNIYCSFAFHFAKPIIDFSPLSLAVAVIVIDALKRYGIHHQLQLKWPNDLYFAYRKLGGILIESFISPKNIPSSLVIGIGLNTNLPANNPVKKISIDLQEIAGDTIQRNKLLGILIDEMMTQIPYFFAHGFKTFLVKWQKHDMLKNKFVVVKESKYEIPGIAQGINDRGELMLRDAKGKFHTFCYGDVSVNMSV